MNPCQVICEGDGDSGFIAELARAYQLPTFDTMIVSEAKNGMEGAIASMEAFVDRGAVRRILIVADNDDNPTARFQSIQRMVGRVRGFPPPSRPLHIRPGANVKVAVVMLPNTNEMGNLETLFLKDIATRHPELLACADALVACERNGRADDWRLGDRHKMILRSIIAARLRDEPNCSLSWIWHKVGCPIDIRSPEFKWVADFVGDFFAAA